MPRTIADTVVESDVDEVVWHGYALTKSSIWLLEQANEERTQMRKAISIKLEPWCVEMLAQDVGFSDQPGDHSCSDEVSDDPGHQGVCAEDIIRISTSTIVKPSAPFDTSFSAIEEIDHSGSYDNIVGNTEGSIDYHKLLNRCE